MRRRSIRFRPAVEPLEKIALLTNYDLTAWADPVTIPGENNEIELEGFYLDGSTTLWLDKYTTVAVDWGDGETDQGPIASVGGFGNGPYAGQCTIVIFHTYENIGNYTINVTVDDTLSGDSFIGTTTAMITAVPPPPPPPNTPTVKYDGNAVGPFADVIGDEATIDVVPPTGKTIDFVDWASVPHAIKSKSQTFDSKGVHYTVLDPSTVPTPTITFNWDSVGGSILVEGTAHYSDSTSAPFSTLITVFVPSGLMRNTTTGTVGFTNENGDIRLSSSEDPNAVGFGWDYKIEPNTTLGRGGKLEVIQTLESTRLRTYVTTNADGSKTTTTQQLYLAPDLSQKWWPLLDNDRPGGISYDPAQSITAADGTANVVNTNDTPRGLLDPTMQSYTVNAIYHDFLMYQPPNNGIWVPIGHMTWGWSAKAENVNPDGGLTFWYLDSLNYPTANSHVINAYQPDSSWPVWNNSFINADAAEWQTINLLQWGQAPTTPFIISAGTFPEPGPFPTDYFTISRGGSNVDVSQATTVYFDLIGNVQAGVDYTVDLSWYPGSSFDPSTGQGSVIIPAGYYGVYTQITTLYDPQWSDDGQWSDSDGQGLLALIVEDDSDEMGGQPSYAIQDGYSAAVLTWNPVDGTS